MKITKTIKIHKWNDSTSNKIISFWKDRKVRFKENSDNYFHGKRGSIFGNLTSFDMKNLITKINIEKKVILN